MKWSWKVARVAGTDLRVHATFLILLAWVGLAWYRQSGAIGAAVGLGFTLALFTSVVLHEIGHALMARRFGVRTRDIMLLPIGGVARLDSIPENPRRELLVATAGPAVTLLVVATLLAVLLLRGASPVPPPTIVVATAAPDVYLAQLMWLNLWLLGFNLLPAFPMDGGRVLRALLAMRMDYQRATLVAARLGKAFAAVFGIVGILYSPLLVLIAFFVWLGASSESVSARVRSSISGMRVEQVMIGDIRTLKPDDTLSLALEHVLAGFQEDFPVVEGDRVVGMLTRASLLGNVASRGRDTLVSTAMERSFASADSAEPLEHAVARLAASRVRSIPVLHDGTLRGLLTADNIGELVMIDAALRKAQSARRRGGAMRSPAPAQPSRLRTDRV